MPTISVIIPVYNVEKYLCRCLDSLLAQSFADWEAICVDDGSRDSSPEILDRYAASDKRFVVVHKKNEGAAGARNTAIGLVRGRYCLMVDADDFIHPQLMEIAVHFIESTQSDIVAYTYNRPYHTVHEIRHFLKLPDRKRVDFHKYDIEKIECRVTDRIFDYATERSHNSGPDKKWMVKHCQPWRCLIRSEIAVKARFCDGIMYEDLPWWGEILINTRRACIINLPIYYYYPNPKSYIHASKRAFKIFSLERAIAASEELFKEKATEEQRLEFEKNFLSFFRSYLEHKKRRR